MQLKALVFDLDGTLLDSAADLAQALNATLHDHDRAPLSLAQVKSLTGDGMMAMLNRAFMGSGLPAAQKDLDQIYMQFIKHYSTLKPDRSQLYPHVIETLQHYRGRGVKIGLCTNKQEQSTHRLMRDLEIHDLFDNIAGGDTFSMRKPHPGHIRGVLDALGIEPHHAAMIGDSANDVIAAQGAGVKSIAVTHGYGSDVKQYKPNAIIGSFADIEAALTSLGFV